MKRTRYSNGPGDMAHLEPVPFPKPLKYFIQLKVAYECRPHWQPTKAQKAIASVEGFFGRILNNQARVLEARATRTGIPQGPGASVLPPKSYFDNLPPDLEVDGPGARLRASVASGASAETAHSAATASTSASRSSTRPKGHAFRAGQEMQGPSHSGESKRLEGRGAGGPVLH